MRYVVYSTWCVFYLCFIQGAWSCLRQDMDFERHATFLFFAPGGVLQRERSRDKKECKICRPGRQ